MNAAPAKADRFANRAPKGGMVSPINGRFYLGGQFMPMVAEVVEVKPAILEGSTRQVAWASRLRRDELAMISEVLTVARLELASPRPFDAKGTRRLIRRAEVARHGLMTTRSAAAIIDRRMAL